MKRLIKNYYFLPAILLLTLVSVIAIRCKKPTDGINITVNTSSLFHYTALVQVVDPSGSVPNNLTVTASGPGAGAIYGIDGKKALAAPGGIIALAVHPKMEPTATAPIVFNLTISGPGYLTLVVPVTISSTQNSQVIKANILNLTVATPGVSNASTTAAAVGGTVATTTVLTTPTSVGNPESTTITLPATTKLQDANGNTINASSVSVSANNFNTSQPSTVNLFPGSSLASTNVVDNTGATTSAVFVPAGFVNVDMTAGGVAVKKFSAPVTISMTLDPGFKDPTTGATLVAGNTLGIYSYSNDTGQWKFEQNAPVTGTAPNLSVTFTTNHLTQFFAGKTLAMLAKFAINITAPWYVKGTATNITVTAAIVNGPSYNIYQQTFQLDDLLTFVLDNKLPVPATTTQILLTFTSSTGTTLGNATLTTNGTSVNVTLSAPPANPPVTLLLNLDCTQAKQGAIVTPPDFYLLYKPTGQPVANYAILGQVKNGGLTTTQLSATAAYDFKAILNSNVKEVINHTVAENTAANQTVGGVSFNGTKVPAQNKIDINALCNSLP
ncbi:autotransporter outer membrane beta-barrel domain-containing protein [Mucilaginibacter boryungensis]|uniref:Uncharacterized protein n=1 Tax=Mucilaginibacter boryungensis TaxID=768480 RepID=A0ABR9XLT9_9SPHI|nr:hypothetical protein [Mucilaginibacter boryungensis]MBE9667918.1 hypothetical protein [Mucilaginibacter boryungensis]